MDIDRKMDRRMFLKSAAVVVSGIPLAAYLPGCAARVTTTISGAPSTVTRMSTVTTTVTSPPATSTVSNAAMVTYEAKDYSKLLGMPGFSNTLLNNHFTLYQGYVKNTNTLLEKLNGMLTSLKADAPTPEFAELKRRMGWEFNGMRLHEFYFDNVGGNKPLAKPSKLTEVLAAQFGSYEAWELDFRATGAMRGIGWVTLYQDNLTGVLFNQWINEHDTGHWAGCRPILIMDVFEHAYMVDYGIKKVSYIDAFFKNVNWEVMESRLV